MARDLFRLTVILAVMGGIYGLFELWRIGLDYLAQVLGG